jgi:hypothetical protein
MCNPVAQVEVSAVFTHFDFHGEVAVSKDKVIIVFAFQFALGIVHQLFFVFTQKYDIYLA